MTEAVDIVTEDVEEEPGLAERHLRFVLLKAIADAAAEELGQMRADHLPHLLTRYKEDGSASFRVKLPGTDVLVATVSLAVPKAKLEVTDHDAFVAWALQHHGKDGVVDVETIPGEPEHTVVVPATEDREVKTLIPKGVTAVMKHFKATEDGVIDLATGVLVDGVENVPGAAPKSFSVKYETDGQEILAGAYRAGKLDGVVAGTSSLPLTGSVRTVVERRLEMPTPDNTIVGDLVDAVAAGHLTVVPGEHPHFEPADGSPSGLSDDFDPGGW